MHLPPADKVRAAKRTPHCTDEHTKYTQSLCLALSTSNCLSNTLHGTEYKITLRRVSVCVCARDFGVEYLENVKRSSLGVNGQPVANGLWGIDWSRDR